MKTMQTSGFGRKGLAPGAPSPMAARPQATAVQSDPFAAQRAAFLAQERALRPVETDPTEAWEKTTVPTNHVASKPQRSMWMAYLLWFFLGQFSAHRFYLGATGSAITQLGMAFCGLALAMTGGPAVVFSLFVLVPWMLWLFVDLFLIPGLHRRHCRSTANLGEMSNVFA
jgi:TM2 domain-containing membrane protein YozV